MREASDFRTRAGRKEKGKKENKKRKATAGELQSLSSLGTNAFVPTVDTFTSTRLYKYYEKH